MIHRLRLLPALVLALSLPGCDLVGDVFEAGLWAGVILVVVALVVLALGVWALFQLFD